MAFATLVIPAFSRLFMQLVLVRRRSPLARGMKDIMPLCWLCCAVLALFTTAKCRGR